MNKDNIFYAFKALLIGVIQWSIIMWPWSSSKPNTITEKSDDNLAGKFTIPDTKDIGDNIEAPMVPNQQRLDKAPTREH